MLLLFVIVIKWPAMFCSLLTLFDLLDKGLVDIEKFEVEYIG